MAIGSSPDMGTIRNICYYNSSSSFSMNDSFARTLAGAGGSGTQYSMSSFIGKNAAGSGDNGAAGTYSITIPVTQWFYAQIRGAGGGGGGGAWSIFPTAWNNGVNGGYGGESRLYTATNLGGEGGGPGTGGIGFPATSGYTVSHGNGFGQSGATLTYAGGSAGGSQGAGNGGGWGGLGGNGGKGEMTWYHGYTSGYPTWGASYTYVNGSGGSGGAAVNAGYGGNGTAGYSYFQWG